MENLDQNVAEAALEAVTEGTCSIKKAAPVLVPVGLVLTGAVVLFKWFKSKKAKKAADVAEQIEEVNPENPEVE